jgi:hypothetical protein
MCYDGLDSPLDANGANKIAALDFGDSLHIASSLSGGLASADDDDATYHDGDRSEKQPETWLLPGAWFAPGASDRFRWRSALG